MSPKVTGTPPSPRTYHTSSAVIGDRLYVFGGGDKGVDPVKDQQLHIFDSGKLPLLLCRYFPNQMLSWFPWAWQQMEQSRSWILLVLLRENPLKWINMTNVGLLTLCVGSREQGPWGSCCFILIHFSLATCSHSDMAAIRSSGRPSCSSTWPCRGGCREQALHTWRIGWWYLFWWSLLLWYK